MSAMTGEGVEQFIKAVREGREEYEREYRPEYERLRRERDQLDMKKKEGAGGSGKGAEVDIGGLCHSMREEVEVPDNIRQAVFLRHPGDEEDMEEEVSSSHCKLLKKLIPILPSSQYDII